MMPVSLSLIQPAGLFDVSLVRAVGWTLVHSMWLLLLISQVYLAVDRRLARASAQARYVLGVVTLLLMAAAPLVTLGIVLRSPAPRAGFTVTADLAPPANENPETRSVAITPHSGVAGLDPSTGAVQSADIRSVNSSPVSVTVWRNWSAAAKTRLDPWLPLLVAFWALGAAVLLLRPCLGLHAALRMRRRGLSLVPPHVMDLTGRLCWRLGLRPINVRESARVMQPVVVGWLRPIILLPACLVTNLPVEQLEAVLAHELAHVRRHDWLVNALQLVIEALLFYHPAVWWVSRRIREERENCCDDLAIAIIGSRQVYGRMLLGIEQFRQTVVPPALAANGGSLPARIRRIVRPDDEFVIRRSPGAIFTGVVGMGLTVAVGAALYFALDSTPARAQVRASTASTPTDAPAEDGLEAQRGMLRGRIIYDGTPPEQQTLHFDPRLRMFAPLPDLPDPAEFFAKGIPDESLLVGPDGGLRNVVVWVYSDIESEAESETAAPVRIRARNGRFEPHVTVYDARRPVELSDEDPYSYDFHAWPLVGDSWNVLVAPSGGDFGPAKSVVVPPLMPQSRPVRLSNDIYSWFEAWVLPLNHSYFAVTDDEGRFEIPNLPPGEWKFAFWHERAGWLETDRISHGKLTLTIAEGVNDLGDVRVDPADLEAAETGAGGRTGAAGEGESGPAPNPAESEDDTLQPPAPRPGTSWNGAGFAPLHLAAWHGNLEAAARLLERGEQVDVPQQEYGGTPLQYAATYGHADIVDLLLEHGATVDTVDTAGRTPLMWAAQNGQREAVRLLIEAGADVNRQMHGGWTPLHYAVRDGYGEIAQLLTEAGADLTLTTRQGKTAADLASAVDHTGPKRKRGNES